MSNEKSGHHIDVHANSIAPKHVLVRPLIRELPPATTWAETFTDSRKDNCDVEYRGNQFHL